MPASLVESLLSPLLPITHIIVNKRLPEGKIPEFLKDAIVELPLKEPSLVKENSLNYRPESNVAVLGKIIENIKLQ